MQAEYPHFLWSLFILWFVVYWILGGVFFAIVAARFMNTRKALFSCLFTAVTIVAAYGATVGGMTLAGRDASQGCATTVSTVHFSDLIPCSYPEIFAGGGVGFMVLIVAGAGAMIASRAGKKK